MMRIKDLFPDASGSGRVLVLGELLLDFVPCDSDMRPVSYTHLTLPTIRLV